MLGTRITSFAFGFACASGISMYKLKEEIWSSHKILADQVRPLTRADPDRRRRRLAPTRRTPRPSEDHQIEFSPLASFSLLARRRPLTAPPSRSPTAVRRDGGPAVQAGDDDVQAVRSAGVPSGFEREDTAYLFACIVVDSCVFSPPAVSEAGEAKRRATSPAPWYSRA